MGLNAFCEEKYMSKRAVFMAAVMSTAICAAGAASAWSEKPSDDQDLNTVCKFEPGAQCTGAVRIEANLEGVDMHNASMPTMRLDRANLMRANLSGAILQLSNLQGAKLTFANLERAHLHAVNLQGADLKFANLSKASLLDADLRGADLLGANLDGTVLIQAKLDDATWTDGRICAKGSVGTCD